METGVPPRPTAEIPAEERPTEPIPTPDDVTQEHPIDPYVGEHPPDDTDADLQEQPATEAPPVDETAPTSEYPAQEPGPGDTLQGVPVDPNVGHYPVEDPYADTQEQPAVEPPVDETPPPAGDRLFDDLSQGEVDNAVDIAQSKMYMELPSQEPAIGAKDPGEIQEMSAVDPLAQPQDAAADGADASADGAGGGQGAGGDEGGGGGGEPPDEPPSPSEDYEPRSDIQEEFEELQQRYGQQQIEVPDEGPDPNRDEPNRIPELDQYPGGEQRDVALANVRPTQADISKVMGDGKTTLEDVTATMRREGWDATQPDPDMVQNEDGTLTTLDHRRLSAAEGAGLEEVPATVHAADEPLSEDQAERFKLKKKVTDPETGQVVYPKNTTPENWGEAAELRAAKQDQEEYIPRPGRTPDIDVPKKKATTKPSTPPAKPSTAPAKQSLDERAKAKMGEFVEKDARARQAMEDFENAEDARKADLKGIDAEDTTDPEGGAGTDRPSDQG
jgi:hypothetical protein